MDKIEVYQLIEDILLNAVIEYRVNGTPLDQAIKESLECVSHHVYNSEEWD